MELETYKKGAVIFKKGEFQMWMYHIQAGSVGIYANYGENDQTELTVLHADDFLGELGLIDSFPRSATAVALESETVLRKIDAAAFSEYFKDKPAKILVIMQSMCNRMRGLTDDYMEACKTIAEYLEAEEKNQKSEGLINKMKKFVGVYRKFK